MARVYGRVPNTSGGDAEQLTAGAPSKWTVVKTDAAGYSDYVFLTALVQALKLNRGESPFWGNYGIPAKTSVLQQLPPDYSVALTTQFFAPQFASLLVSKRPETFPPLPTYDINVVRKSGSTFETAVAL